MCETNVLSIDFHHVWSNWFAFSLNCCLLLLLHFCFTLEFITCPNRSDYHGCGSFVMNGKLDAAYTRRLLDGMLCIVMLFCLHEWMKEYTWKLVWNGKNALKFDYSVEGRPIGTPKDRSPMTWLSISMDRLGLDAGCGMIVISSLILSGFNNESPPVIVMPLLLLLAVVFALFLLSMAFLATVLWAEYTWFSNCLYIPNVAVHTVHLYDKWAGFKVMLCSRETWFSSFHWYICKSKEKPISTCWTCAETPRENAEWNHIEIAYSSTNRTTAGIFAFVGSFLHWTRYQTMWAE